MSKTRNELELKKVSFSEVELNAKSALRAGSTSNIQFRYQSYKKKYKGIMFYAPTQNMEKAENKLLSKYKLPDNDQRESNSEAAQGIVYVIKGTRILRKIWTL